LKARVTVTLPATFAATIETVWLPSLSPSKLTGETHGAAIPVSSLQVTVVGLFVVWNPTDTVGVATTAPLIGESTERVGAVATLKFTAELPTFPTASLAETLIE
jgi:hypothetical protein